MAGFLTDTTILPRPRLASPVVSKFLHPQLRRLSFYGVVVCIILSIYSYPALRSTIATKSLLLPPVTAPDEGLYLSISQLRETNNSAIVNPYYHVAVPVPVSYLKFRLGPILFGLLNRVLHYRIWWALFAWNLFCSLGLCLSAIWLFERFLPNFSTTIVAAGVTLITIFSFEGALHCVTALMHRSQALFPDNLPYIRPFSPQFVVPLIVCYVGLQIRALSRRSVSSWALMAVVQFVAFAALPYATIIMAGTTAVAALYFVFARFRELPWSILLSFLLVCGFLDLTFAMRGSGSFGLSFPGHTSVISFQPALLARSIGKTWILIAILVVIVATTKKLRPEIKWTLVGLGLTNIVFALGDAFVSERIFLLGVHIPYFYNSTLVILLMFIASAYMPNSGRALRFIRIGSLAIIVACFVLGFAMAEGNHVANLGFNLEQSDLAQWFARNEVSADDLVITQFSTTAYDDCEWVPLLSSAEVLYCRNAQLTLTAQQNRGVQRLREVLYLYFNGKDQQWLENATQFESYGLYGEISSFHTPAERLERIIFLRNEMRPYFKEVEDRAPSVTGFFRGFRRIWIVQKRDDPQFVNSRLGSYLDIKNRETAGTLIIAEATAN